MVPVEASWGPVGGRAMPVGGEWGQKYEVRSPRLRGGNAMTRPKYPHEMRGRICNLCEFVVF